MNSTSACNIDLQTVRSDSVASMCEINLLNLVQDLLITVQSILSGEMDICHYIPEENSNVLKWKIRHSDDQPLIELHYDVKSRSFHAEKQQNEERKQLNCYMMNLIQNRIDRNDDTAQEMLQSRKRNALGQSKVLYDNIQRTYIKPLDKNVTNNAIVLNDKNEILSDEENLSGTSKGFAFPAEVNDEKESSVGSDSVNSVDFIAPSIEKNENTKRRILGFRYKHNPTTLKHPEEESSSVDIIHPTLEEIPYIKRYNLFKRKPTNIVREAESEDSTSVLGVTSRKENQISEKPPFCDKTVSAALRVSHEEINAEMRGKHACAYCHQEFYSEGGKQVHERTHFRLGLRPSILHQHRLLVPHRPQHLTYTGDNTAIFSCSHCGKVYGTHAACNFHEKTHHVTPSNRN